MTTACGSPCYAPPEMVAGKPYNGIIGDILLLGSVTNIFWITSIAYTLISLGKT